MEEEVEVEEVGKGADSAFCLSLHGGTALLPCFLFGPRATLRQSGSHCHPAPLNAGKLPPLVMDEKVGGPALRAGPHMFSARRGGVFRY